MEARGGHVMAPTLPNTNEPNVEEQIKFIVDNAQFNENTILVGHSLGAVVAMKALERKGVKIRKLVLLSGFVDLEGCLDTDEAYVSTFDWTFDYEKIKSLTNEIVVIGDKNDTDVPPLQAYKLAKNL